MRYLLILLLLACLAGLEYFHHLSNGGASDALAQADPRAKSEGARDMLRRHLHNH